MPFPTEVMPIPNLNKIRRRMKCGVFVLGEIGRSPRMQYHALSISRIPGNTVYFIGVKGPKPLEELQRKKNVKFVHFPEWWKCLPSNPLCFLFVAPFKLILQTLSILFTLLWILPSLDSILIQIPPSLPTLPIIFFFSFLSNCKIIIDWHNFGYTLLALKPYLPRIVVFVAYLIEKMFSSRKKYKHICVSQTMRRWLKKTWGIHARTVYDKPSHIFQELTVDEKHEFLERFYEDNPFTMETENGDIVERPNRPALVISSTSWTKDEDFSILLEALRIYDKKDIGPEFYVVITGKGPMKEHYKKIISEYPWKKTKIRLAWLKMEDYPKLLGSADLGVSLHLSSSGIDLPMKVVDMFGCNLPVCAIQFEALKELVVDGENGLVFKDSKELAVQFLDIFRDFPKDQEMLMEFRGNLRKTNVGWDDEWEKITEWFTQLSKKKKKKKE